MFEAHNLSSEELDALCAPQPCWQKIYHRRHTHSLRPLKIWFAEGKRKDSCQVPHSTRFVYIEYLDNTGNSGYRSLEVRIHGQSVEQILRLAVDLSIPALQR